MSTHIMVARYVCLLATAFAAEPLTLKQALEQLDRMNPDLAASRLRSLEAAADTQAVRSGFQPQASLALQTAYQTSNLQGIGLVFPGFPSRIGPYRTFNARPQVTQAIVDLSLLAKVRATRARQIQSDLEVKAMKDELAIAVVQIYLQALQARSQEAASEARLQTAGAILRQTQDKEEAGTGSKLDVARAVEQMERERVIRIEATRDAQVLETLLLQTIGREQIEGGVRLEKPEFPLSIENEVQRTAQDQRPDLLAQQAKAKAAGLERRVIDQQRMPKVSAFGDYGLLGAGPDRSIGTYTVGINLTVPVWTGRRIESEAAAAQARADAETQRVRSLRIRVQQEVRQADLELRAARESLQAATRGVAAARESLELARLRFESGLATSVDTQIAQSGLATAEDSRIRNEYEVLLAEARLAKAGGAILSVFVK
jgi:outer membrane protein TolC